MTEQEWDELYPNGTREWSTRRMPKEHLQNLRRVVAELDISLAHAHAYCLGVGIEKVVDDMLARR